MRNLLQYPVAIYTILLLLLPVATSSADVIEVKASHAGRIRMDSAKGDGGEKINVGGERMIVGNVSEALAEKTESVGLLYFDLGGLKGQTVLEDPVIHFDWIESPKKKKKGQLGYLDAASRFTAYVVPAVDAIWRNGPNRMTNSDWVHAYYPLKMEGDAQRWSLNEESASFLARITQLPIVGTVDLGPNLPSKKDDTIVTGTGTLRLKKEVVQQWIDNADLNAGVFVVRTSQTGAGVNLSPDGEMPRLQISATGDPVGIPEPRALGLLAAIFCFSLAVCSRRSRTCC